MFRPLPVASIFLELMKFENLDVALAWGYRFLIFFFNPSLFTSIKDTLK